MASLYEIKSIFIKFVRYDHHMRNYDHIDGLNAFAAKEQMIGI